MFVLNRGDEGAVRLVGDGAGEVAGGVAGEEVGAGEVGVLNRQGRQGRGGRDIVKSPVFVIGVFYGVVGAEGEAGGAAEVVIGAG